MEKVLEQAEAWEDEDREADEEEMLLVPEASVFVRPAVLQRLINRAFPVTK